VAVGHRQRSSRSVLIAARRGAPALGGRIALRGPGAPRSRHGWFGGPHSEMRFISPCECRGLIAGDHAY
jgi:hypothetical protein